jgi:formylglycine-generating enzyme required for sulfatase activity
MIFKTRHIAGLIIQPLALVLLFVWSVHGERIQIHTLSGQPLDLYRGYRSLVVEVERYDHWKPRTNAEQDARDVSRELERLGASVVLLIDPTLRQLRLALIEFAEKDGSSPDSGLIFYFAGNTHSVILEDGRTIGWMIPKDAPHAEQAGEDLEQYAISTDWIAALADQIQSRHLFFLFDAPLYADALQVEPPVLKVVDADSALPVRQFITGGHTDKRVAEHGVFKRFLLQGLRGEADVIDDGLVSASELAQFLSDRLPKISRGLIQPQFGRLYGTGDGNSGDFIIKRTARSHAMMDDAITNSLEMRFVYIRPGSFMMGSPAGERGRSNDETRHRVKLTQPYFMQNTEVTVGQFKQFVQFSGYKTEAEKSGGCWTAVGERRWTQTPGTSWQQPGLMGIKDNLPATCVSWNDAVAFARWLSRKERLNYRLPTEAEWEYAGRAGISAPFSTGHCLSSDAANYGKIGYDYQQCTTVFRKELGRPTMVGLSAPNPLKLYNIHGNVSEWCRDWYGPYSNGSAIDPEGPGSGSERVMRGGTGGPLPPDAASLSATGFHRTWLRTRWGFGW